MLHTVELQKMTSELPRRPWVASEQYGMRFIVSQDNEILLRADWMAMAILRAMVAAVNEATVNKTPVD